MLVGLPAIGLKGKCRRLLKFPEEPARWEPPGVPDDRAGAWSAAVVRTPPPHTTRWWTDVSRRLSYPQVSALLTVFLSLTEDFVAFQARERAVAIALGHPAVQRSDKLTHL